MKKIVLITAVVFSGILLSAKGAEAQAKEDTMTVYRKKIDMLDKQIIDLLGERMDAAKAIGIYKMDHNIQVVQSARFNDVLQAAIKQGKEKGLSEAFIKQLYNDVHAESVRQQETLKK